MQIVDWTRSARRHMERMKARSLVTLLWMLEIGVMERGGRAGEAICGAMELIDIGFGVVVMGAGESARGVMAGRIVEEGASMGSSVRLSTVTSANVVVGGSFRRTVRKVSWK